MSSETSSAAGSAFESVALVLQGGGAMGAYQAGVYQGLHEAGIRPDWIAGISIGAINAALIAGNPPERRVSRLREFWTRVTEPASGPIPSLLEASNWAWWPVDPAMRATLGNWTALRAVLGGQNGFFLPRVPPSWAWPPGRPEAISVYDTAPLRDTLEELVDWNLLNGDSVRLSVGAVDIETGNFEYFDSAREVLTPEHIMASGALPPGFPPVQVGRRWFWDGGLVSNTPLEYVLDRVPRRDTLAFQVDLWSARGALPRDLADVLERDKEIRYSSRTRKATDTLARRQNLRHDVNELLGKLPPELRDDPAARALAAHACTKVMKIVHLIYRDKPYESHAKDYTFDPAQMDEHWQAGLTDIVDTFAAPGALDRPSGEQAVETFDIHRQPAAKETRP
jgi:NTE family protein